MTEMLETLPAILAATLLLWPLSLILKDCSIIDIYWAPAFALTAWFAAYKAPIHGFYTVTTLILITIWASRLGIHIYVRHGIVGEDPRYAAMRTKFGQHWWWWSLFQVFLLQAILIWVISWPLQVLVRSAQEPGLVGLAGLALALLGLCFEAIADRQLTQFRADPDNRNKVMARGLWRWSRHPNYFGDTMMWWGFFIASIGAGAPWWSIIAPIAMTILFLKISGITLMEETITDRRPGYADYISRTSAFIPLPPRS